METTTELVTPELAAKFLEKNNVNREIRLFHVAEIADLINRDKWQLNHQGIAFNKDGYLLDGQHRLLAIIKAGKAVQIRITRNLDIDHPMGLMVDQLVLKRNAADMMRTPLKETQIASAIAHLCNGWHRPPVDYIQECMQKLKTEIELASLNTNKNVALLGKAAVKAAAVSMCVYDNTDYALQSLARLNAQDFANMTPIEHSYSRIIANRSYIGERQDQIFARALSVFDKRNADAKRLFISEIRYIEVKSAVIAKIKGVSINGN